MALGHTGKHMTTETKLRIHHIASKSALCYENENWITNRSDPETGSHTNEIPEAIIGQF
jgi:hypothetical protein